MASLASSTLILSGLYALVVTLFTLYRNLGDLHKFQQNSYRPERYWRWLRSKNHRFFKDHDKILLISGLFMLPLPFVPFLTLKLLIFIVALLAVAFSAFIYHFWQTYQGTKIKLSVTPRVKRQMATVTLIQVLFFCLILAAALKLFCFLPLLVSAKLIFAPVILNIFSFAAVMLTAWINSPIEKAINQGFINDAKRLLAEHPNLIVIGITGSYGKTSVKNMLHSLLSEKYSCLMTPESYNTTLGVVRTIREQLKPYHEVFIVEMGAREIGDIMEICQLVRPAHTLITSIGPQHLETFKTLENVIRTKGEIFEGTTVGGHVYMNLWDENIRKLSPRVDLEVVTFGDADFTDTVLPAPFCYPQSMQVSGKGTTVTMVTPSQSSFELSTRLLGRHNIENITACTAIALKLGLHPDQINRALKGITPVKHRLSYGKSAGGYMLIDDAFNSNPIGSRNALEALRLMDGQRKFVMTPGMIELGSEQDRLNRQFGVYMASCADVAILVGEKQTKPIYEGLLSENFPKENIHVVKNLKAAFETVNSMITLDDVLLIENDLPDIFNE